MSHSSYRHRADNMFNQELSQLSTVEALDMWAAERGLADNSLVKWRRLQLLTQGNHECSVCEQTFKHRRNMLEHERQVHGEKKHECSTCGAKFSRLADVRRHEITHETRKRPRESDRSGWIKLQTR